LRFKGFSKKLALAEADCQRLRPGLRIALVRLASRIRPGGVGGAVRASNGTAGPDIPVALLE